MSEESAVPPADPTAQAKRGPRVVDVLIMLSLPLLFLLIDTDPIHQAGAPRRWLRRLRARAARLIAGGD